VKAHSVVYKAHSGAAVTHSGVVESLKVDVADLRHFEEDPDLNKKRPDSHKNVKPDPDLHQSDKPVPDPHQSKRPDPHELNSQMPDPIRINVMRIRNNDRYIPAYTRQHVFKSNLTTARTRLAFFLFIVLCIFRRSIIFYPTYNNKD
jgi:hypothetical protein